MRLLDQTRFKVRDKCVLNGILRSPAFRILQICIEKVSVSSHSDPDSFEASSDPPEYLSTSKKFLPAEMPRILGRIAFDRTVDGPKK